MISSIRCLRSALSSWLDTMDPLPGLGLMVPPYDAPPTSTGTNRASYLLRSRLPRAHTFSASFSRRSGLAYEQQIPRSIRTVQSLRFYPVAFMESDRHKAIDELGNRAFDFPKRV